MKQAEETTKRFDVLVSKTYVIARYVRVEAQCENHALQILRLDLTNETDLNERIDAEFTEMETELDEALSDLETGPYFLNDYVPGTSYRIQVASDLAWSRPLVIAVEANPNANGPANNTDGIARP